jgi:hypothetical protein
MKPVKRDISLGLLFSIRRATLSLESSRKIFNPNLIRATFAVLLTTFLWAQTATAQEAKPFTDFKSYVTYVAKNHKAPFDRDGAAIPPAAAKA